MTTETSEDVKDRPGRAIMRRGQVELAAIDYVPALLFRRSLGATRRMGKP